MDAVQAELAQLLARLGLQPLQLQTDHGPCFLGAEDGSRLAVPGRLTLWLASLGIAHRFIPVRQPHRNGAVERFHGAVETSWRGEGGGLEALRQVWNVAKPGLDAAHQPYRGRVGSSLAPVWALLAGVQVERRVDSQGKCGLWNRPLRVGRAAAGQEVRMHFDAARRLVVVTDAHALVLCERELDWLTETWLWEPVPLTAHASHASDTSTMQ
jgi:transposase InsO family protein